MRALLVLLLALPLLAGCSAPPPAHVPAAAAVAPAARPSIVLSGSFTASGCLVPSSLVAAAPAGTLGDVKPIGSEAWGRTYTATGNATATLGSPLCLAWYDAQGAYVWSPTPGVVPEKAVRLVVEADGQAVVAYRVTIH